MPQSSKSKRSYFPPRPAPSVVFSVPAQPDAESCGLACLKGVYESFGAPCSWSDLRCTVRSVPSGGTIAQYLGLHAIDQGCSAEILTVDVRLYDPTWFERELKDLGRILVLAAGDATNPKIREALIATRRFLDRSGIVRFGELTRQKLLDYLNDSWALIAGISVTFLERQRREGATESHPERGVPVGHFVVVRQFDVDTDMITLLDPLNRGAHGKTVQISFDRFLHAWLLGALTRDATLLAIRRPDVEEFVTRDPAPRRRRRGSRRRTNRRAGASRAE